MSKFEKYVNRAIQNLMKTQGDNCSVCGREFQHCDLTFRGLDANGTVQLTGSCCAEKIKRRVGHGIYLNHSRLRGAS